VLQTNVLQERRSPIKRDSSISYYSRVSSTTKTTTSTYVVNASTTRDNLFGLSWHDRADGSFFFYNIISNDRRRAGKKVRTINQTARLDKISSVRGKRWNFPRRRSTRVWTDGRDLTYARGLVVHGSALWRWEKKKFNKKHPAKTKDSSDGNAAGPNNKLFIMMSRKK